MAANKTILRNKKVLLVEDNEMNRLLATTVLEHYGVKVDEAFNGAIAVQKIKENKYDLVLMDVEMPVMDGLEATCLIRKEIGMALPIIALTASVTTGIGKKCEESGMNDFLSKPFKEKELVIVMTQWLSKKIKKPIMNKSEKPVSSVYSLDALKELSQDNDTFLNKMIGLFIQTMPAAILEMEEACQRDDFKSLNKATHKIKSVLASFNMVSVEEHVIELEHIEPGDSNKTRAKLLIDNLKDTVFAVINDLKRTELKKTA